MKISKNSVAALTYELRVKGEIADKATAERPLEYIQGIGMLIPKFEAEVEGKEPGDSFAFTLSPEEGYGQYNPEQRIDLPKTAFSIDGKVREDLLTVGRMIPMLDNAGQVVQGIVVAVSEDQVTMDFNHPMAGQTLDFSGTVISVREATEKELKEGLHGEFLPKEGCGCGGHCGGGCGGNCGGGCGGGCHEDGESCNCNCQDKKN